MFFRCYWSTSPKSQEWIQRTMGKILPSVHVSVNESNLLPAFVSYELALFGSMTLQDYNRTYYPTTLPQRRPYSGDPGRFSASKMSQMNSKSVFLPSLEAIWDNITLFIWMKPVLASTSHTLLLVWTNMYWACYRVLLVELLDEAEFVETAKKEYDETTINPASDLGLLVGDYINNNVPTPLNSTFVREVSKIMIIGDSRKVTNKRCSSFSSPEIFLELSNQLARRGKRKLSTRYHLIGLEL